MIKLIWWRIYLAAILNNDVCTMCRASTGRTAVRATISRTTSTRSELSLYCGFGFFTDQVYVLVVMIVVVSVGIRMALVDVFLVPQSRRCAFGR